MDRAASWENHFVPPIGGFCVSEANYICHSDGGTRAESCSATGWILEAVARRGDSIIIFPVAMKGIYIENPISSFLAETIALEDAVTFFTLYVGEATV